MWHQIEAGWRSKDVNRSLPRIQNYLAGVFCQLLQRQMDSSLQSLSIEVNFEVGYGMLCPKGIVVRQRIGVSRLVYICHSLFGYRLGRRTNSHGGKGATGRVRDECFAMLSKSNLGKAECAAEAEDCSHSAFELGFIASHLPLIHNSDESFGTRSVSAMFGEWLGL